ncbi:unnamed protein product [Acanthoscelides obtectus]|uniref:RFX-type winged-helix domain-containing protein n=1 Tax=Acanthoscelides obtectus TaxID=200917 RepID=A0A9P0PP01_ACAOB|nr:unnamed protein product [Acanthoscelides obtectus]CAK1658772.1 DNA-binding protein RFX5 [Acanthoscelides obtectus]
MENEIWTGKYRQSGLERTKEKSNNGQTETEPNDSGTRNAGTDEAEHSIKTEEIEEKPEQEIIISETGKQTIQNILEQIKSLSPVEKFLLFLRLPSEVTHAVDPFRQPLNPLGSRSEIYKTISWIKTHLEEDPDISLPKQEVYNEYSDYCESNSIKPLSQADFGKVMKQVYPKVRARRLGTRGNSRYCYSGLRRCIRLKAPTLPDLADKPMSTEVPFTQAHLESAAWSIVKGWAEQQLSQEFPSIQSLAFHILSNFSFGIGSEAANVIATAAECTAKEGEHNGKSGSKHREMQIQLQRKLQQKSEGKERKRKMQSPKSEQKPSSSTSSCGGGGKKSRNHHQHGTPTAALSAPASASTSPLLGSAHQQSGGATSGECSTASSGASSPAASAKSVAVTICDKQPTIDSLFANTTTTTVIATTQLPTLPEFNGFQRPATAAALTGTTDALLAQDVSAPPLGVIHHHPTHKVPIPRLQSPAAVKLKQQAAAAAAAAAKLQHAKYKLLQPRQQQQPNQQPECDIAQSYNPRPATQQAEGHRSQTNVTNDLDRIKERRDEAVHEEDEVADFPLTRERINSVSNVEKDAMDEYLGTNNEHDEELSKYFSNNNVNEPAQQENSYKLSHLRQLLEQNGIAERKPSIPLVMDDNKVLLNHFASTGEDQPQIKTELAYTTPLAEHHVSFANVLNSSAKRRVSFETPAAEEAVLASPNTKRKNFSFTPISPGPQSPNGIQSKCSSTTASPFISPRDTPILKAKPPPHQNMGILKTEARKPSKVKRELSLDLPSEFSTSSCLPMSAPVSPMLQKLLKSNSKLAYNPSYANCQNVSQAAQLFDGSVNTSRSQSVPLQQMVPDPMNTLFLSDAPASTATTNTDFPPDVSPLPQSNGDNSKRIFHATTLVEPQCDNVDLFNIDITANNSCLNEFGIQLINSNIDLGDYARSDVRFPASAGRTVRSQSIDVVTAFEVKSVPSRSVPSTPLPFICNSTGGKPSAGGSQKIGYASSRSYPSTPLNSDETFTYNVNTDCLLNGQPIRSDSVSDGLNDDGSCTVPVYDEIDKDFAIDGPEFQMVAVGDIESVLTEQNFSGNIN